MIQGSKRTDPRNHYTIALLVITRDTRLTSTRRLILASAIKNTSKNRENTTKICWLRVGISQTDERQTVRWQIWSKQNLNLNVMAVADKIEIRGMRDPWSHPQWAPTWYKAQQPNRWCRINKTESKRWLVSTIPVNSEWILSWFQLGWKAYLLSFPYM
jgi:hypothetical protein